MLCVFNNSQTVRAPLALALSVNDCKSWEPLAIIEEDPKGAQRSCLWQNDMLHREVAPVWRVREL